MSKISLSTVTGANNQTAMNSNFTKIAEALNNRVLWRDNIPGEPNQLIDDIDSNNKRIYNLPEPVLPHEAARLKDLLDVAGSTEEAIQAAAEAAASASEAVIAKDTTVASAGAAQTAASTAVNASIVAVEASQEFLNDGVRKSQLESTTGASLVGFQPAGVPNTVSKTVQELVELSVLNFGADPTGAVDSTLAFNRYIAYMLTLRNTNQAFTGPLQIRIPRGKYLVGNINFTNFITRQTIVEGNGSVFINNVAGKPVIDALDSRWIRFRNLTIYSDAALMARNGIQIGSSIQDLTVGNNYFDNVFCVGHYTQSAISNYGSETTAYMGCNFENRNTDRNSYAAVFDGMAIPKFYPQSDYRPVSRTVSRGVSFTNNFWGGGTQIRNTGGGTAIFVSASAGFTFDTSCYALSFDDAAIELYSTGTWRNRDFTFNGQFENTQNNNPEVGNIGIRYGFKFTSDGVSTNTAIGGLTCDTFGAQCEVAFILNATGGNLRISNMNLRLSTLSGEQTQTLFSSPVGNLTVDGHIKFYEAAKLNIGSLTSFNGYVETDDATLIPSLPAGAYVISDRLTGNINIYGGVGITNNKGSASPITFRNTSPNGLDIYGATTAPSLRAGGTSTDIDLSLQPKGAGLLRYGVRTTRADTPVTGSFPMKMADGTTVYVALVAAP